MTDPNTPNNEGTPTPPPAAPQTPPAAPAAPSYGAQQPYGQPYAAPAKKSPVLSIISLIAGILGVLLCWAWIGIVFGIGAVVLGFIGRVKEPQAKGMWLTGIILGFVAVLLAIVLIIVSVVVLAALSSQYGS